MTVGRQLQAVWWSTNLVCTYELVVMVYETGIPEQFIVLEYELL